MAEPMRIRATLQGDVADVRILMMHPMETGQRKDSKGQLVPQHFIKNVVVTHNGKVVFDAQWSQAVSRNPFLGVRVKGAKAGDKIGVTWTDNDYAKTFFGISADQSARSGLPVYDAKSGINTVRFSLGANYRVNANWGIAARFTGAKLRNDAAESPVTVDKTQNSFAIFATYRF